MPIRRGLPVFRLGFVNRKHALNQIGPNANRISPGVPEGCSIDQAVYVVRHGSRYPDSGAYEEWQALHEAVCLLRLDFDI